MERNIKEKNTGHGKKYRRKKTKHRSWKEISKIEKQTQVMERDIKDRKIKTGHGKRYKEQTQDTIKGNQETDYC